MKPELSVIPEREIPAATKRRKLTPMEVIHLTMKQDGYCGCGCGEKLDALREGVIDEHLIPLAYGREDANDLPNRALYRKPCARRKTDEEDLPGIAQAKRRAGETCNAPGKPIPKPADPWGKNRPNPPKAKWAKRSFGRAKKSPTPTHKEETRDG